MSAADQVIDALVDGRSVDWLTADTLPASELRSLADLEAVFAAFRSFPDRSAPDPVPPASLPTWGALRVIEVIGRGASSVVYRATDPRLDRQVALKLITGIGDLPSDLASTAGAQVVNEGRLAARVRHPGVVTVFGADIVDGLPGIWMEFIEGRSLAAELADRGPLSAREAALVGAEVCAALAALHRAGLLHRDVKPHNIMRELGGRIVLMDLGAGIEPAATSAAVLGRLAGTPRYMAPELFRGQPASIASDLYGLGALMYYLTTLDYPVAAEDLVGLKAAHAGGIRRSLRDARPDLDPRFVDIVEAALDAEPSRRPPSAGVFHRQLSEFLGAPTVGKTRSPGLRAAVLVTTGLVAGVVLGMILIGGRADRVTPAVGETTPSSPGVAKAGTYVREQLDAAEAFEELAAEAQLKGQEIASLDRYEAARRIYAVRGPDMPAAGVTILRSGWVRFQAGRYEDARGLYELAFIKLGQELGGDHPLVISTLAALAVLQQHDGRFDSAAQTMQRALLAQRRLLGDVTGAAPPVARLPLEVPALAAVLRTHAIDVDSDGDWLSDAVEAMLGTSSRSEDSDRDGHSDAEGDADRDGWPDGLEYALAWDPSGVLALSGGRDPRDLAYQTSRPADGHASSDRRGWVIRAPQQAHYFRRFTSLNVQRAATRGFRLTAVVKPTTGGGFVCVDLGPTLGRFDLHAHAGGRPFVQVQTSVVPLAGPTFDLAGDQWHVLQIVFDPTAGTASFWLDGRRLAQGLRGHHQFLERYGFMVGAANDLGQAPEGELEFRLAMVEIR